MAVVVAVDDEKNNKFIDLEVGFRTAQRDVGVI